LVGSTLPLGASDKPVSGLDRCKKKRSEGGGLGDNGKKKDQEGTGVKPKRKGCSKRQGPKPMGRAKVGQGCRKMDTGVVQRVTHWPNGAFSYRR